MENDNPNLTYMERDGQKRLATRNLTPGLRVYGEQLVQYQGSEWRIWDPLHSKHASAILNGLRNQPFSLNSRVLYLGTSTGTTASHVSDIIGPQGRLYGVDSAPRVFREFLETVAKHRINVIPILADARFPLRYRFIHERVDIIYCDIAQPDQTQIAILNCEKYLKHEGILLLAIKARSIDVLKTPKDVFKGEQDRLESEGFEVIQAIELEPFQKDHLFLNLRFHG
jgi:fibrillarin-like pre-rRNA processing protein